MRHKLSWSPCESSKCQFGENTGLLHIRYENVNITHLPVCFLQLVLLRECMFNVQTVSQEEMLRLEGIEIRD